MANLYSSHVVLCSILFRLYVPWKPIGGSLNRENCSSKTMTIPLILYNGGAKSFHKKKCILEKSLFIDLQKWDQWIERLLRRKPIYKCGALSTHAQLHIQIYLGYTSLACASKYENFYDVLQCFAHTCYLCPNIGLVPKVDKMGTIRYGGGCRFCCQN